MRNPRESNFVHDANKNEGIAIPCGIRPCPSSVTPAGIVWLWIEFGGFLAEHFHADAVARVTPVLVLSRFVVKVFAIDK